MVAVHDGSTAEGQGGFPIHTLTSTSATSGRKSPRGPGSTRHTTSRNHTLSAVLVELPIATTIMLRAVACIAQGAGEDLSDPKTALACVQAFALAGVRAPGICTRAATLPCEWLWQRPCRERFAR